MAHSLSAKKRIRQSEKRRLLNRGRKNAARAQLKRLVKAVDGRSADAAKEFAKTQERLDRLAAKGVIHPNKAARLKSRWARKVSAAAKTPVAPGAPAAG